jgi:hypothetical protein
MSLHDRAIAEGALGDALHSAFGTPEKFGGSSEAEKKREKERKKNSLGGLVKRAAKLTAKLPIKKLLRNDVVYSRTLIALAEAKSVDPHELVRKLAQER